MRPLQGAVPGERLFIRSHEGRVMRNRSSGIDLDLAKHMYRGSNSAKIA
jgi:hypothetical protein